MSIRGSAARRLLGVAAASAMVAAVAAPPAAGSQMRFTGAVSPSSAGASAAAAGSVVFGGLSGQGWPDVLAISPDTKRLRLAVIGLRMNCTSGSSFAVTDAFGGLAVSPKGRVHAAGSLPAVTTPTVSMTGGSHAMGGTLNRRQSTFSGWWRLQANFKLPDGGADHCDSGRVTFAARL